MMSSIGVNGMVTETETQPGITTEWDLNHSQSGLIATLAYTGLMVGIPLWSQTAKRRNPFRLLGLGMLGFCVSEVGCALSPSFGVFLFFRFCVGVFSGALIAIGPPFADDTAPPGRGALWLSLYFLCLPLGVAVGYFVGGQVGLALNWRAAFWLLAGGGVPLAALFLLLPPLEYRRSALGTSTLPAEVPSSASLVKDSSSEELDKDRADVELGAAEGRSKSKRDATKATEDGLLGLASPSLSPPAPGDGGAALLGPSTPGQSGGVARAGVGDALSEESERLETLPEKEETERGGAEEAEAFQTSCKGAAAGWKAAASQQISSPAQLLSAGRPQTPPSPASPAEGSAPLAPGSPPRAAPESFPRLLWFYVCDAGADALLVARHPLCVCVTACLVAWNGFMGAFGYYGPRGAAAILNADPALADGLWAATTAGAGVVGSLLGGAAFDAAGGRLFPGALLSGALCACGTAATVVAIALASSPGAFWSVLGVGQVLVMAVQPPANAMLLWSVPLELRAFALAIAETLQHVLGDIPSPPVVGKVQDAVESWRLTLCLANVWMAVAALCCFLGAWCAPRARDYHREELQAREVTEQVVLLRDGHAHGAAADLVARMGADLTRRRPVPDEVG